VLDLHRLTILREIKLSGSMTAAARKLSYSHSAISQQMAQLERDAGVPLLDRVGRNVVLTSAGEELVRNTEAILAAMERAESDLASALQRPAGVVTVAAFPTISRAVVPAALALLARRFPGLDVRLRTCDPEEAVKRLVARQVDAVFTDAYPGTETTTSGVHVTVLGNDPIRCYLPDPAMDGDFDRIRTVPWVMEPGLTSATQWALRVCRERGFEPMIAHESADLLFHLRMVEEGLAAAFLPDMVVREGHSTLTPCTSMPIDQQRTLGFVVRAGAEQRPQLTVVRDAVAEVLNM
jgi:molybdate transport repressor ModE-like protein